LEQDFLQVAQKCFAYLKLLMSVVSELLVIAHFVLVKYASL